MQRTIYYVLNLLAAELIAPTAAELLAAAESSHDMIDQTAYLFSRLITFLTIWTCLYALLYQWLRYHSAMLSMPPHPPPLPGLKKAALGYCQVPTAIYPSRFRDAQQADCVICLTEFADGNLTKTLSQCGHVFHMGRVDEWLRSSSSWPSCR